MQTQTDISDLQNPNYNGGTGNTAQVLIPKTLIDEVSATEFYIGVSIGGNDTGAPIWSIRRIVLVGTVWATALYPNGDQSFNFIWDDRTILNYA